MIQRAEDAAVEAAHNSYYDRLWYQDDGIDLEVVRKEFRELMKDSGRRATE